MTKNQFRYAYLVFATPKTSRFAPVGRQNKNCVYLIVGKNNLMKSKKIEVRVSLEERDKIFQKSEKSGLSVSEYMRRSALEKNLNVRFSAEELEAWKNLTYISSALKNLGNILSKDDREELILELKKTNEKLKVEILKFL